MIEQCERCNSHCASEEECDKNIRIAELESALKVKDGELKLWEDANGQLEARLKELAEECLPHIESSLARTEKRVTKCKLDRLLKLHTLMANQKRTLIAKLKLLVNK